MENVNESAENDPIFGGLNPEQRAVVEHFEGALRVGAVAGAGKTTALVKRIANMVLRRDVDPRRILSVTFSTRAAKEMNERLAALGIDTGARDGARVGTWHSLCWQIVRAESPRNWTVDTKDRYRAIVKMVTGYKHMEWDSVDLTVVLQYITICKAHAADPTSAEARAIAEKMHATNPRAAIPNLLVEAYGRAEVERKDAGLITFDDMLVEASRYLADDVIRRRWASKWDFVSQDEAQDESPVQQQVAEALARDHGNYMVVGDPAQAIYGFRGSDPKSLVTFEQRWPAAVSVYMHRNYRSGSRVIDAANAILGSMPEATRLEMTMTAERGIPGEVLATTHLDSEEEAAAIVADIQEAVAGGAKYRDNAILYRVNAYSRCLEEALLADRIPYLVLGGTNFYQRKEVRTLLSYLRAATPRAKWDDVKRTINAPFRYLAKRTQENVRDAYDGGSVDTTWPDAVRAAVNAPGVWAKQRAAAETYAGLLEEVALRIRLGAEVDASSADADRIRDEAKPARLLGLILAETGFITWLRRDEGTDSSENDRTTNVQELVRASERFPTVDALLDYVDEQIERAEKAQREQVREDVVLLMSIHKSKGLEWPRVYLAGAIDGILPHAKNEEDPDEERRLAYVAVTRSRDYFRATAPRTATFKGRVSNCSPSRFLAEAGIEVDASEAPAAASDNAAE